MDTLIVFLMAVIALMIVPGPDMAYCIASGLSYGKRGAFYASLGVGIGGVILALATAALIYAAHVIDDRMTMAIQVVGCLYLLYLSAKIIIPRHTEGGGLQAIQATSGEMMMRGIVTNLSNPKALVFFLSFIPQFIPLGTDRPELYALWLGLLLCIVGVTMNFGFGLLGTAASPLNRVVFLQRSLGQYLLSLVFMIVALGFLVSIVRSVVL